MSKQPKKMTRAEAITVAQEARKVPTGYGVARPSIRLPLEVMPEITKRNSEENGIVYQLGLALEADGYLLIYDILDRLGVRIVRPIVGNPLTIVCRHKTYEGSNQAELLLEILRDRLENFRKL